MFDLIPFGREERNLFNYFDNLERQFFGDAFSNRVQFRTDIVDKGDRYVLTAELPGFNKEDIQIDLSNNCLTIQARKNEETKQEQDTFIRRERRYGSFTRSFDVSQIHTDQITASYENGILSLELPKAQPEPVPPSRQIEIR